MALFKTKNTQKAKPSLNQQATARSARVCVHITMHDIVHYTQYLRKWVKGRLYYLNIEVPSLAIKEQAANLIILFWSISALTNVRQDK